MTIHDKPVGTNMSDPAVVTDQLTDAEVAEQIRTHHAAMVAELDRLTAALRDASAGERGGRRQELAEWFVAVLVPHADEEEATTYRAAGELAEGRLLIEAMVREHVLIKRLVALFSASEPVAAAAYGRAVFETFESHQRKENDVILPLLVDSPQVSLAKVMGGEHGHHQVGEHSHSHA